MKQLETERLLLRTWRDSDLEPFIAMNQDSRVMRYFPGLMSEDESRALVVRIQEHFDVHGFSLYAVERKDTTQFIGFVGLLSVGFDAPFTPAIEIGWRLAYEHWGQGFATEAAKAVLNPGFEEFGLPEIVSFTAEINCPSRRVMKKIGMTHDPKDDFDHPKLDKNSSLRPHVLYRIQRW